MKLIPITDAAFLLSESRETPMHVGGLHLYTLPKGVKEAPYLASLRELLTQDVPLRNIFDNVLKMTPLRTLGPMRFEQDKDLDIDYHVRFSAVPAPGRYRELFELVSRLQSTLLDRSRPLWEFHIISGLKNKQFATFFKFHHALTDGVGAMHILNTMHSPSSDEKITLSPFSREAYDRYKESMPQKSPKKEVSLSDIRAVGDLIREQFETTVNVTKALTRLYSTWVGLGEGLSAPWHQIPKTKFNNSITGARRFVAQSYDFQRIRNVGKEHGGTINDTILAMCAGALRKYLVHHDDLPDKPLKAMVPVSLRASGDTDSANAIGFVVANLSTDIDDPIERYASIKLSMDRAKEQLADLTPNQIRLYTLIFQSPMILTNLLGTSGITPASNMIISNVPGPREQVYLNGSRLDGTYPAGIPMDGMGINFTQVSNHRNIDFGINACRKSVPHLQRLIDYLEDALVQLEDAASSKKPAKKKSAKTKKRRKKTNS